MTNILQNPHGISHANANLNTMQASVAPTTSVTQSQQIQAMGASSSTIQFKKSLNREARKRELMKITREN